MLFLIKYSLARIFVVTIEIVFDSAICDQEFLQYSYAKLKANLLLKDDTCCLMLAWLFLLLLLLIIIFSWT